MGGNHVSAESPTRRTDSLSGFEHLQVAVDLKGCLWAFGFTNMKPYDR